MPTPPPKPNPPQPAPIAPAEEDRTRILSRREMGSALPIGHQLNAFTLEAVIGEGGFSIVYRARDQGLDRLVALKEYIPSSLAYRAHDGEVAARSERHRETYQLGLRSFLNEARLLASFDHPSLVKVYTFWEQHGTAYMVMPYYKGPTLRAWVTNLGTPPSETWLRALAAPLIDALERIHADRCYHRDVAPDNILLLVDREAGPFLEQTPRPLLLDFGAARRVISDATQSLTVILKAGYAPIEQYAQTASMRQGPWTDVYALCAVLYSAVTGHAPPASVGRVINDEMPSARQVGGRFYTPQFLAAIDAGLAVRPNDRPQSMSELRRLLAAPADPAGVSPPTTPIPILAPGDAASAPGAQGTSAALPTALQAPTEYNPHVTPSATSPERTVYGVSATSAAAAERTVFNPQSAAPPAGLAETPRAPSPPRVKEPAPVDAPSPVRAAGAGSKHSNAIAVGSVAALVLVAGLWWWITREAPVDAVVSSPAATAAPAAPEPISAAPQDTPAAPAAAPPVAVTAPAPTPSLPPAGASEPFSLVSALHDIVKRGDPSLAVNATAEKSTLAIGRDQLRLRIKSSQAGYLYLFLAGTDKNHFYLLFPNQRDANNRVADNQEIAVPRPGFSFEAAGPPGTNHIVAMVSRRERDLSGTGLRRIVSGEIPEFDLAVAKQRWTEQAGSMNPFVGKAICPKDSRCDERYGATLIEIEEVNALPSR